MERLKGVALTDLEGIKDYSSNPEATLITALNTWSMSVMMAESFHAVRSFSSIDRSIDETKPSSKTSRFPRDVTWRAVVVHDTLHGIGVMCSHLAKHSIGCVPAASR